MTLFPLLSLPSLALEHVVKLLGPFELFDLSQCSRKSVALIRLASAKRYELSLESHGVVVNDTQIFEAGISGKSTKLLGKRKLFLANGKEIFVYVGCNRGDWNRRNFFFIDRDFGLQIILFHLAELFGCRVDSINTGRYLSGEIQRFSSIIGRVIEKQKVIRSLVIENRLNESDLRWILDNLAITDYFKCDVSTSPNFEYEFKTFPRELSIHRSHWFKLDDLLAAAKSCVAICLYKSYLENKDIDVFMKAWASGEFPTLRYLEVESRNLNERDQILGRKPAQWWNDEEECGVKFRRDDGIEAVVEMNLYDIEDSFILNLL